MTRWVAIKERSVAEDNARQRAEHPELWAPVSLSDWHRRWEHEWPEALRRNPMEPRLTCPWQLLEDIEMWAVGRGWYRSGFGPNGHQNGFNVFFRRLAGLSIPGPGPAWSQDELNGDPDGI